MDISGIFKEVRAGGFRNPMAANLNVALASFTPPSLAEFTAMAQAQAIATGATMPDSGQLQAAINSINSASNSVQNLLGHTNKLTGVDMSSDVMTIVAKTMNAAKTATGEKSCATVLSAFGALQNMAGIVTDTVNAIHTMEVLMADIPRQIAAIPAQIEAYANKLEQQVITDVAALAQARIVVAQNAIAAHLVTLVDDECVGAIFAGLMTEPLKLEVKKVTDVIKAKKLISISGK
jgi:hypothetical protein